MYNIIHNNLINRFIELRLKYLSILLLCLGLGTLANIKFLNVSYTENKWQKLKQTISCMANNGTWVDVGIQSASLYPTLCDKTVRFVKNLCNSTYYELRKGLNYLWQAKCGHFQTQKLNREKLCSYLKGTNILNLGDSMTEEFHSAFLSAILDSSDRNCHQFRFLERGVAIPLCKFKNFPSSTISYHRHDYFLLKKHFDFISESDFKVKRQYTYGGEELFGYNWMDGINQNNINLIIVNRGLHYRDTIKVIKELNDTFSFLTTQYPNVSIIFRSTSAGHEKCKRNFFNEPLNNVSSILLDDNNEWGLSKINHQNQQVHKLIDRYFPMVLYLDIFPSTILCADSHPISDNDCLHYCHPGPVDNWIIMLYNLLYLLKEKFNTNK